MTTSEIHARHACWHRIALSPVTAFASLADEALRIITAHGEDDANGLPMAGCGEEVPNLVFGGADTVSNVRGTHAVDRTLQAPFSCAVVHDLDWIVGPDVQNACLPAGRVPVALDRLTGKASPLSAMPVEARRPAILKPCLAVNPARRSRCSGARVPSLRDAAATAARARARTAPLHTAA